MLAGLKQTDNSNQFIEAQRLLYILTGQEPKIYTGQVDERHRGEHLRFSFSAKDKNFDALRAKLKLFNIAHCSVLYKILEPRDGTDIREFYITVAKEQFKTLQSYFAPGATTSLKLDEAQFDILGLNDVFKATLLSILFSPHFISSMKERCQDQYSLDGVIYYIAKLTMNTMPCFAYLKEQGLEVGFSVVLDAVSSQEESSPPSYTAAITPLRDTRKRPRVSSVPDIALEVVKQRELDKDKHEKQPENVSKLKSK